MLKTKAGLLPFYIELYDDFMPEMRSGIEKFLKTIENELKKRKIEVYTSNICRKREEFEEAINYFIVNDIDTIITLHLAYSPSMESLEPLLKTKLPIIVLDTTPSFKFSPKEKNIWESFLYNHGIHGVQDICSMLVRNNKYFTIHAGHWKESNVLDKVARSIKIASIYRSLSNMRVGIIGESFKGMGDFYIEPKLFENTIGIKTIIADENEIKKLIPSPDDKAINMELDNDLKRFKMGKFKKQVYIDSLRISIAIRRWIEKEDLSAFTFNYTQFNKNSDLITAPFLETSKAMSRGIGYAGEGDTLTAALLKIFLEIDPSATFTEMFCPDWKDNRIFISHLGEVNLNSIANKPLIIEKELGCVGLENSIIAIGNLKPGKATIASLTYKKGDGYKLVVSTVNIQNIKEKNKTKMIVGWFEPEQNVEKFLMNYSNAGGGHHLALAYNDIIDELVMLGRLNGWEVLRI